MTYVVQFSTGLGSAEVARRLIDEHGAKSVLLLTADTRVEDPDNWRFAHEFVNKLGKGVEWVTLADGRTPMQVGRDLRVVPNNRLAVCSRVLKRELLRKWIDKNCDPKKDVIALGFDWTEPQRHAAATPHWEPYEIDSPLMREPFIEKWALMDFYQDTLNIKPPRLYETGAAHANCGGACVRSGQAAWALLLKHDPATYDVWEQEENTTREMLGKDVAILRDRRGGTSKPLPLGTFRRKIQLGLEYDRNDFGVCGCDPFVDEVPNVEV